MGKSPAKIKQNKDITSKTFSAVMFHHVSHEIFQFGQSTIEK
jgi:hypothetical protein